MVKQIEADFRRLEPKVDYCSLRYVCEIDEIVSVRQDVPQPVGRGTDTGIMVTIIDKGGLGYAATCDSSSDGIAGAIDRAWKWAKATAGKSVTDFSAIDMPSETGSFVGPGREGSEWESTTLAEKLDALRDVSKRLKIDDKIVDWSASLWHTSTESLILTPGGGRVTKFANMLAPGLHVVANSGANTQVRTHRGARGACQLGGLEMLDRIAFYEAPQQVASEAIELLSAENCPTGKMDILLAPDQMILQIHESIGHPLEIDRILGDERNYAGTSFVTPDMFGSYRYGSDLLNVSFDPTIPYELASYGFDDEGCKAEKEYIIREGILQRGLGGSVSQVRSGLAGVANARASSWNRPPIDRMANLNLEHGESTLDEMIASIERGVYMKTNCSWSIDDSRNKFQFGCEWGRLIEDGKLTSVVRNPNYRGVSATFWRNLKMVGDNDTAMVLGTPNCGKGEPNQVIRVGHSSPTALFADVEVFGGE
ncbi:MAG TPA: TldD/PmbA family protein [Phycisphaerae bacterium]|nr:TldD/PmbA family protein [Phycisphaerae bacterium]